MGRGANLEEEVELFMAAREKVDAECQNRTSSRQACWILYGTYAKWQSKVSKVGFRQSGEKASIWSSYHPPGQVPDKLGGFSVWNLCNWQSKVSKVGFRPLVMNHFPTKSATLKFLTRMAGSGTEFQHQTSEYLRASQEKEQNSPSIQSYQAS
uniref:Uncharacterized protein n=1 Tax=Populus alba TaxID=43335 RepID=A0A4U5R7B3_POPAL|nr:hypothetical protein D5086_0000004720 [Populus alba]